MVTILAPRWLNLKGENFALVNSQEVYLPSAYLHFLYIAVFYAT